MKRKIVFGIFVLLALLLLILLTLPVWFPWVLRPLARSYGLQYGEYERDGYARLVLRNVTYDRPGVSFQAGRVETLIPTAHLWNRYFGDGEAESLSMANWKLTLTKQKPMQRTAPPVSVYSGFRNAEKNLSQLLHIIPNASLTNGTIDAYAEQIAIPYAALSSNVISAELIFPKYKQHGRATLALGPGPPYVLKLDSPSMDLRATATIDPSPNALRIQADGLWLTNRFQARAQFSPGRTWPDTASLEAKSITVPAEFVELRGSGDLNGSLDLRWMTNQFTLHLQASTLPQTNNMLRPVDIELMAHGDTNSAWIQEAYVSVPGFFADLRDEARIKFRSPFITTPIFLDVFADLSRQNWYPAAGRVVGKLTLLPGDNPIPTALIALSGTSLQVSNLQAKTLQATAALAWPWLTLSNAVVEFPGGASLATKGSFDLQHRTIRDGALSFTGTFGQEWLPAGYAYSGAQISAQFRGPFNDLNTSGKFQLDQLITPYSKLAKARGTWTSRQLTFEELQLELSAGASALNLTGSASLGAGEKQVRITALDLRKAGQELLALNQPARIKFESVLAPAAKAQTTYHVNTEPLHWVGPGGEIHLTADIQWPQQGRLNLALGNLPLRNFEDFFPLNPDEQQFLVNRLTLDGEWNQGPLQFTMECQASGILPTNLLLTVDTSLKGAPAGLEIQKLLVSTDSKPVVSVAGSLPVAFLVHQPFIRLDANEPLRLEASTKPQAFFWNYLAQRTGLGLKNPELELQLGGTWQAPQGKIKTLVSRIDLPAQKRPLPPIEYVELTGMLDAQSVSIPSLTFLFTGQPVTMSAKVPLPEKFWANLREAKVPDWSKASGRIEIRRAPMEIVSNFAPKILARQGTLDLDLSLLPGARFDGQLTISNAATAPLPNLGAVRDLQLVARLEDRDLRLNAQGTLGGSLLTANGVVDLHGEQWLNGALPPFSIALSGTNVTLVRQLEVVVRADVNATVNHPANQPVTIGGVLLLRDSLFLQELSDLVAPRVARPASRPPYFSVTNQPFADWKLDLKVFGDKFLRVRTPVFNGELSANFQLSGTLQEPLAIGNLKIESGTVRFPFASLPVTQGEIRITSQDPYRPELFINASAQAFGYDIRMQVTGSANKPVIRFSSTPSLTSEQILIMLTSGEMPRGKYGLSSQQRAQSFAAFLGRSILSQLGFGSGAADRLIIRSGEEFTETGRPTYSVEYKINPDWSIIGQYDRFSDYNLMLKWRIYSK